MSHQFNRTILREYDVRGIVGQTLNPEDAYALGRSYAALARTEGARRIAVGRDGRTHSPEMEAALVRGLTEGGLDVVRIGMGPSPMLYFAVATLGVEGGIQVTGSHNPADYNGFKLLARGRSFYGEAIQRLRERVQARRFDRGAGSLETRSVIPLYIDDLAARFRIARGLRVVVDCGTRTNHRRRPAPSTLLTPREAEIISLITQGFDNFSIAREACLSINSVKTYIRTAYRKMGVTTRSQAVLWGVRNGYLDEFPEDTAALTG